MFEFKVSRLEEKWDRAWFFPWKPEGGGVAMVTLTHSLTGVSCGLSTQFQDPPRPGQLQWLSSLRKRVCLSLAPGWTIWRASNNAGALLPSGPGPSRDCFVLDTDSGPRCVLEAWLPTFFHPPCNSGKDYRNALPVIKQVPVGGCSCSEGGGLASYSLQRSVKKDSKVQVPKGHLSACAHSYEVPTQLFGISKGGKSSYSSDWVASPSQVLSASVQVLGWRNYTFPSCKTLMVTTC